MIPDRVKGPDGCPVVLVGQGGGIGWLVDELARGPQSPIVVAPRAKRRYRGTLPALVAAGPELPLAPGTVGLLAAYEAVGRRDADQTLRRWHTLLAPAGQLLIVQRAGGLGQALGIKRPPAAEQLTAWMLNAGFVAVSQRLCGAQLLTWGTAASGLLNAR